MRLRQLALGLPLLALMAAAPRPEPFGPPPPPTPYDLCDAAIAKARAPAMPPTLLPAIARVESGRLDPVVGRVRAWPWTINVEGQGSFFETKQDAIAAVQTVQARGQKSVDVGCMQVNLMFHPTAFPDLETAFDPEANATYAVRFLLALFAQAKDWGLATAYYHSQTQEFGEDYQRRVFGRVVTPMGPPRAPPKPPGQFGAFLPNSALFGAIPPASAMFGAFAAPPPAAPGLPASGLPAPTRSQPTTRR